ncbi:Radical SAM protein (Fragment) OS=Streptomyces microflavus OX=1919 GN=G3I39_17810 PE=4 SV=1 [Streptomyces microflavus]
MGSFTEENRPDVVMLGRGAAAPATLAGELSFLARRARSRTAVRSGMFFARTR